MNSYNEHFEDALARDLIMTGLRKIGLYAKSLESLNNDQLLKYAKIVQRESLKKQRMAS